MKGTGLSTGSMGGGVAVGVSNAGARGAASMGIGGGSSIERGMSGGNSAFSSRGLSMFNREVISKPSVSILNPNFGKGAISPHARTSGLASSRGVFDISRPVVSNPISNPVEFGVGINIKNGLESVSKTARSASLKPRGMFDLSSPVGFSPVERNTKLSSRTFEFGRKITSAKAEHVGLQRAGEITFGKSTSLVSKQERGQNNTPKTREVGQSPRVRSESAKIVSPLLMDVVTVLSRQDKRVRTLGKIAENTIRTEGSGSSEAAVKSVQRASEARTTTRKKEMALGVKKEKVLPKRKLRVGHMVHVLPNATQDAKLHIYADIKRAQSETVHVIRKARNVSYSEALVEAAKALEAQHKGKIVVTTYEPQIIPGAVTQVQSLVELQNDSKRQITSIIDSSESAKTETQAKSQEAPVLKVPTANGANNRSEPENNSDDSGKIMAQDKYYFTKDSATNETRKIKIKALINRLIAARSTKGNVVTGWDLETAFSTTHEENEYSELTRPFKSDNTLQRIKDSVKLVGHLMGLDGAKSLVDYLVERNPAVRLSKRPDVLLKGQDAEHVYNQALDHVPAYVQEDGVLGKLSAQQDTRKVAKSVRNQKSADQTLNVLIKEN